MLRKYFWSMGLAAASALCLVGSALADDSGRKVEPAVHLLASVPVPVSNINTTSGALYSFDISYVDQSTGVYYLADRSNKAVDVLSSESIVTQIFPNNGHAAFAGFTPCAASKIMFVPQVRTPVA